MAKLTEQEKDEAEQSTKSRTVRRVPEVFEVPRLCEESKEGHLVKVKLWPPKQRYTATKRTPSVPGECTQCGAHVIVYDPIQPGLRVQLPSGKTLKGVDTSEAAAS